MDEFGNVSQAPLSEEDAKIVLTAANQSCQPIEAQVGELKPDGLPWITADALEEALRR
jgi:hypothetical protein